MTDVASQPPARLIPSIRSVWTPEWDKFDVPFGLRASLAIGLCLLIGLLLGTPHSAGYGALAASGALTAGFGAYERIRGSSLLPMLAGTIGCALACFAGTLVGHADGAFVTLAAIVGTMTGLSVSLGTSYWYISLQVAITALVSASYPDEAAHTAALRAGLMLAGGILQTFFAFALRRLRPLRSRVVNPDRLDFADTMRVVLSAPVVARVIGRRFERTRQHWLRWNSPVVTEALRVCLATAAAAWASRALELRHSYWAPMTAMIVLKSDLHLTLGRGLARVTGTLAGVALSAALLLAWHGTPPLAVLCTLAWLFSMGCFSIVKANYAIYSICITGFVVCELAFIGDTDLHTAFERGFATMLAFALATLSHLPWHLRRVRSSLRT